MKNHIPTPPNWQRLAKMKTRDAIVNHTGIRQLAALAKYARGRVTGRPLLELEAYQLAESAPVQKITRPTSATSSAISSMTGSPQARGFGRIQEIYQQSPALTRSLILKEPRANGEKGVIYLAFEYNLNRLASGVGDFAAFHDRYDLIVGTSWSPTNYAFLLNMAGQTRSTIWIQPCNYEEITKLDSLHPRLKCVASMPCDWINPAYYEPRPYAEREYDLVMVANWAPFKRHFEFFDALSRMPGNLRIALIGQKEQGHTSDDIRALAKSLGTTQELNFFESIPIDEVTRLQCNSKAAVILSRREGCCVAAVEALFAGAPLGLREDAHVGPVAYINEQTGRRLSSRRRMDLEIMALLEAAPSLRPREWAMENISCHQTLSRLNRTLQEHAQAEGRPWTQDLLPMCWRPYPTYVVADDRDKMRPVYQRLHEEHPAVFPANLIDVSHR